MLTGCVSLPGTVVLLFFGRDAEKLFSALEPRLFSNPLAAGAFITIRQKEIKREVLIPARPEALN